MMIFQAETRNIAESIVLNDPLVKNNCVEYELHQWQVVAG